MTAFQFVLRGSRYISYPIQLFASSFVFHNESVLASHSHLCVCVEDVSGQFYGLISFSSDCI